MLREQELPEMRMCSPIAAAPHGWVFLDAEAMPESLRYEELVRRNVVGLGHGWSSGASWVLTCRKNTLVLP